MINDIDFKTVSLLPKNNSLEEIYRIFSYFKYLLGNKWTLYLGFVESLLFYIKKNSQRLIVPEFLIRDEEVYSISTYTIHQLGVALYKKTEDEPIAASLKRNNIKVIHFLMQIGVLECRDYSYNWIGKDKYPRKYEINNRRKNELLTFMQYIRKYHSKMKANNEARKKKITLPFKNYPAYINNEYATLYKCSASLDKVLLKFEDFHNTKKEIYLKKQFKVAEDIRKKKSEIKIVAFLYINLLNIFRNKDYKSLKDFFGLEKFTPARKVLAQLKREFRILKKYLDKDMKPITFGKQKFALKEFKGLTLEQIKDKILTKVYANYPEMTSFIKLNEALNSHKPYMRQDNFKIKISVDLLPLSLKNLDCYNDLVKDFTPIMKELNRFNDTKYDYYQHLRDSRTCPFKREEREAKKRKVKPYFLVNVSIRRNNGYCQLLNEDKLSKYDKDYKLKKSISRQTQVKRDFGISLEEGNTEFDINASVFRHLLYLNYGLVLPENIDLYEVLTYMYDNSFKKMLSMFKDKPDDENKNYLEILTKVCKDYINSKQEKEFYVEKSDNFREMEIYDEKGKRSSLREFVKLFFLRILNTSGYNKVRENMIYARVKNEVLRGAILENEAYKYRFVAEDQINKILKKLKNKEVEHYDRIKSLANKDLNVSASEAFYRESQTMMIFEMKLNRRGYYETSVIYDSLLSLNKNKKLPSRDELNLIWLESAREVAKLIECTKKGRSIKWFEDEVEDFIRWKENNFYYQNVPNYDYLEALKTGFPTSKKFKNLKKAYTKIA